MERYKNLSGNSDVDEFEIREGSIIVRFKEAHKDGFRYYYKYGTFKPGQYHLQHMKERAMAGIGLGGYISREIKKNYEKRHRDYEDVV